MIPKITILMGTLLLLLVVVCPQTASTQTKGASEAIYTGTLRIENAVPQDGALIQVLNEQMQWVRDTHYDTTTGTYGVALFSTDGFQNGDPILFRVILHEDTMIAHPWGAPAQYQGTSLDPPVPPEPITINLTNNHTPEFTSTPGDTAKEDFRYFYHMTANDLDQDPLTFSVITGPQWLHIDSTGTNLTGIPDAGDVGDFEITLQVDDHFSKGAATQHFLLHVLHTNHAPVVRGADIALDEDVPTDITLNGSDVDAGDILTYNIVTVPKHGELTGTAPNLRYTPAYHFFGHDTIRFELFDGTLHSDTATVALTVRYVNHRPVAGNLEISLDKNIATPFKLSATDQDDTDTLRYIFVSQPLHGTLTGTAPNLVYTPNFRFVGRDAFRFVLFDGQAYSDTATVRFLVRFVNHAPDNFARLGPQDSATFHPLQPVRLNWQKSHDVDGDSVFYIVRMMIGDYGIDTSYTVADTTFLASFPKLPNTTFEVDWIVMATDGMATTIASNEMGYFFFDNTTGVNDEHGLPVEYALKQNFPNPFNPTTQIAYALPQVSDVRIVIYSMLGAEVRTLVSDRQVAGNHTALWDGRNNSGEQISSGTYLCRIVAMGADGKVFTAVRKMVLMK